MARDSQLAGDRVQTEYFLQFADHYFRVLGESRSRFEEQNPRRQRDDEMDEDEGEEEMAQAGDDNADEDRPERPERAPRGDRQERFSRQDRPRRDNEPERSNRQASEDSDQSPINGGGETIPFDALPPAIGRDEGESIESPDEEPRRPRRRTRAPRAADDDGEIAPAA